MAETRTPGRSARRLPDLDTVYTINEDGSRNFLHPADVKGRWQVRKNIIWTVLILVYVLLPIIEIGGHPALHIDMPGRAAYIFGQTFTNQDFYLSFFLATGMGFALFVTTSLFGRVWCGYACPQTVFMEGVFRRVERALEGPRERRIRRNQGPTNWDKVWRKMVKHGVFVGICLALAHIFTAYFIPIRELIQVVFRNPGDHMSAFIWTIAWTGVIYFDYAWFREQTCLVICPYGRLQASLIDADTINIGYDETRGEPRGRKGDGGDCIDCKRCVVVCPTGIDIRNGLQLECIGCANCIDACDDIMDRIDRPRGLIRYDSLRGFEEGKRRGLLRPRFFIYVVAALVGLVVAGTQFMGRSDFEATALRPRGLPYALLGDDIRNVFNIRVQNKTTEARTYYVAMVESPILLERELRVIVAQERIVVSGLSDAEVPIVAEAPHEKYEGLVPVVFTVTDSASARSREVSVSFRGP